MQTGDDTPKMRAWLRTPGALAAAGALGVALIMALAPATSAATPAIFHGTTPLISEDLYLNGCAKGKLSKPTISPSTGFGKAGFSASAKTCSTKLGGNTVESYADASEEVGLQDAVHLAKAATNVNVTLNVKGSYLVNAVGKFANCPWDNYTYSGLFSNGTGTSFGYINETEQYCESEAFWGGFLEIYVYDATTGVYTYASLLPGIGGNSSGNYFENYIFTENWTNPAWYAMNYSYTCLNCSGTLGSAASGTFASSLPASISGSWAKGDHLIIYAYAYLYADTYIVGEKGGKATASFNGATLGGHVDVTSITVT